MATDNPGNETNTASTASSATTGGVGHAVRGIALAAARLVGDLLVVTLWVLFLTLLFLESAWPRWAFYALVLLGVGLYVAVTSPWTASGDGSR